VEWDGGGEGNHQLKTVSWLLRNRLQVDWLHNQLISFSRKLNPFQHDANELLQIKRVAVKSRRIAPVG